MQDFDMSGVPGEELTSIPGEERLKNFMELIQAQKGEEWQSRLSDILDSFEDFLTMRPVCGQRKAVRLLPDCVAEGFRRSV